MSERNRNSLDLASMQELCKQLILDLQAGLPSLSKEFSRDLKTMLNRSNHEGIPYFTQVLPKLGKSLLQGLEEGFYTPPQGFRTKGKLPLFLNGLFSLVFSKETGLLNPTPDISAIAEIYQITGFFYKVNLPYSPEKVKKVLDEFVEVDANLPLVEDSAVIAAASDTITSIFKLFDWRSIVPGHGPGSVATGELYEDKWRFKRFYEKINWVYPYNQYFVPSLRYRFRRINPDSAKSRSYQAKVVLVPKDSRGPRLISMEPLEFQFIQQGLSRAMVGHLEKHPITRGLVNFTSQAINRNLVIDITKGKLAYSTIDLSAASDRVSLDLVRKLFSGVPNLLNALEATRTEETILPDGRIVFFKKFAPMGSALCFPVEAVCFFALIRAIQRYWHLPDEPVYVYGDDIIMPSHLLSRVDDLFQQVGLKLNRDKCFTKGPFRESCGMDAVYGHPVTPVRLRRVLPCSRKDTKGILSAVSLHSQLYLAGWWHTASFLESFLQRRFGIKSWSTKVDEEGLYILKCTNGPRRLSYNRPVGRGVSANFYQDFREKRKVFKQKSRNSSLNGLHALHQALTNKTVETFPDPHAGQIKLRWVRVSA